MWVWVAGGWVGGRVVGGGGVGEEEGEGRKGTDEGGKGVHDERLG